MVQSVPSYRPKNMYAFSVYTQGLESRPGVQAGLSEYSNEGNKKKRITEITTDGRLRLIHSSIPDRSQFQRQ